MDIFAWLRSCTIGSSPPVVDRGAELGAADTFDIGLLERTAGGDLGRLIRLLTEEAYERDSRKLEVAVADLVDRVGSIDCPPLRILIQLLRLHLHERQFVREEYARTRYTLDLRSPSQIMTPRKRNAPLSPEIEDIVRTLAKLLPDKGNDEIPKGVEGEVRRLGDVLYSKGRSSSAG